MNKTLKRFLALVFLFMNVTDSNGSNEDDIMKSPEWSKFFYIPSKDNVQQRISKDLMDRLDAYDEMNTNKFFDMKRSGSDIYWHAMMANYSYEIKYEIKKNYLDLYFALINISQPL